MSNSTFDGFPAGTMKFLKRNNECDWFMTTSRDMNRTCGNRHWPSLNRVHRDTRFSKDKTPYKTNVGIHFQHMVGKHVHLPGFYVHIEQGQQVSSGSLRQPAQPVEQSDDAGYMPACSARR
jgi:hypothetical protein